MKKRFIVKVQFSIISSCVNRQALIYNKTKSIFEEGDITDVLIEMMGKETKNFFWATCENDRLTIHEEAPWQNW